MMSVGPLFQLCRRSFGRTSVLRIFYKKSRAALDVQRKEQAKELQKSSEFVFGVTKAATEEKKIQMGKDAFEDAIFIYLQRQGKTRRGHVEFINSALEKLKDYNVHRELSVYKSLFRIFPDKIMVAKSMWQSEFVHFPKQQDCGINILVKMEENGVMPDDEMGQIILSVFGMESMVISRYQRMMYWMPKLRHANPWPVPHRLPTDPKQLSSMAVKRLSVDPLTEVTVHETSIIPGVEVDTFVASSQSPQQRRLLARYDKSRPIYVEGPFTSWFREKQMVHFQLRGEVDEEYWKEWKQREQHLKDIKFSFTEDTFRWFNFIEEEEVHVVQPPSQHEQEDGVIFALAIVGEERLETLKAWTRVLQIENPCLEGARIVFRLNAPLKDAEEIIEELPASSSDRKSLP